MRISLIAILGTTAFGFGGKSLLGELEDTHGLADPASYQGVFASPSAYSTPSNLLERKNIDRIVSHKPHSKSSLLQTKTENLDSIMNPFSSLQEAKSAALKLQASQEQQQDKTAMLRSRIDVFKSELESQIAAAKKEKHLAEERLAKRGFGPMGSSSFVQTALSTDFQTRELEKISEMSRSWKLAADRLAHADMGSVVEPNAALIDANTRVETDKKRMTRLNAIINEDLDRVARDASLVAADEERMKKEQAMRDLSV